jgi:hypothetical protein
MLGNPCPYRLWNTAGGDCRTETTDVDICYEMGANKKDRHPLLGRWAPNLTLQLQQRTISIAKLMHSGRGVLVGPANRAGLRGVADKWADRVDAIFANCPEPPGNLNAMLIRPDGYVAWVMRSDDGDKESAAALCGALEKWFGNAK